MSAQAEDAVTADLAPLTDRQVATVAALLSLPTVPEAPGGERR